jgi:hypothetical protein
MLKKSEIKRKFYIFIDMKKGNKTMTLNTIHTAIRPVAPVEHAIIDRSSVFTVLFRNFY